MVGLLFCHNVYIFVNAKAFWCLDLDSAQKANSGDGHNQFDEMSFQGSSWLGPCSWWWHPIHMGGLTSQQIIVLLIFWWKWCGFKKLYKTIQCTLKLKGQKRSYRIFSWLKRQLASCHSILTNSLKVCWTHSKATGPPLTQCAVVQTMKRVKTRLTVTLNASCCSGVYWAFFDNANNSIDNYGDLVVAVLCFVFLFVDEYDDECDVNEYGDDAHGLISGGDWTSGSIRHHCRCFCNYWSKGDICLQIPPIIQLAIFIIMSENEHLEYHDQRHIHMNGDENTHLSLWKVVIIKIDVEGHECKALTKEVTIFSVTIIQIRNIIINIIVVRIQCDLIIMLSLYKSTTSYVYSRCWISHWANLSPIFSWNGPISDSTGSNWKNEVEEKYH